MLKNYRLYTKLKGLYIESVLLQMNIENNDSKVLRYQQVIGGTVESSERGRDKSYVVTSKKI